MERLAFLACFYLCWFCNRVINIPSRAPLQKQNTDPWEYDPREQTCASLKTTPEWLQSSDHLFCSSFFDCMETTAVNACTQNQCRGEGLVVVLTHPVLAFWRGKNAYVLNKTGDYLAMVGMGRHESILFDRSR